MHTGLEMKENAAVEAEIWGQTCTKIPSLLIGQTNSSLVQKIKIFQEIDSFSLTPIAVNRVFKAPLTTSYVVFWCWDDVSGV